MMRLAVRDPVGPGSETITISRTFAGTYRFSVHDYTGRLQQPSTGLADSHARVRVFRDDGQAADFAVPDEPGTLWTVFEIEGATGEIIPVGSMTYHQDPGTIQRTGQGVAARTDARVIDEAIRAVRKQ